jgi:hypothetical protein
VCNTCSDLGLSAHKADPHHSVHTFSVTWQETSCNLHGIYRELTEAREAQTKSKAIQAAKTAGEEATLQQRIAATSRKAELTEQAKVRAN